jgi:hypothetical protein
MLILNSTYIIKKDIMPDLLEINNVRKVCLQTAVQHFHNAAFYNAANATTFYVIQQCNESK